MNHLIIGNKNYSSWSLRPWLLLKELGISFRETKIPLYLEGSKEELLQHSPSGKVPAFSHNGFTVWDSLAICEYIADIYPEKPCWPASPEVRGLARSISNEMHSGFFEIRNQLPMNCKANITLKKITPELQSEIDRISQIWHTFREKFSRDGEFLFGSFSIADAMYAPVVLRFNSYGIHVGDSAKNYMEAILSLGGIKSWIEDAKAEKEVISECEVSP
jgi:glutathione S-transferase